MKMIGKYAEMGISTKEEAFSYFILHLRETIYTYDFFVAWDKVLGNVANVEVTLNILNSLIGKENIETELKKLIKSYPEIVTVIPLLIAVHKNIIKINEWGGDVEYCFSRRRDLSDEEIEKTVYFASQCGLLKILSNKSIKNLVDYYMGVEVGMDTNARKNRSGTAMEDFIELYVKAICNKHGYNYLRQANAAQIKEEFGKDVPIDKAARQFDFAINTKQRVYLLEVNYYSGGGSKLKSVAGEFKALFELVTGAPDVEFIWVTDGLGWKTSWRSLLETFNAINYVVNIEMIERGILEYILTEGI